MTQDAAALEKRTLLALDRLTELRRRGGAIQADDPDLIGELLEELSVSLQELVATSEELRERNEELVSAKGSIASERLRYQQLYDFSPDGYIVTDSHGVILEANRMAEQLFGSSREFFVGKPLLAFVPVDARRPLRLLLNRLPTGDAQSNEMAPIQSIESALVRRDGCEFDALLRAMPARDPRGAEIDIRWTLRDISEEKKSHKALTKEVAERRRAETSLREAASRYGHLFEHATDLVYELSHDGRFAFCNDAAVRQILGYTARELVGRSLSDLVEPRHRRFVRARLERLLREPDSSIYFEFPMVAKDGSLVWLGQHATAVERASAGIGVQAVCRDITAQIDKVRQLERSGMQLRDLSGYLQTQIEAERARIAREIHDELGAALTVTRMELSLLTELDRIAKKDYIEHVTKAISRLDAAINETRRICSDLRPSLLDNLGLCAAIEWLAQDIQERAGVHCDVTLQGLPEEPASERATALFRIVQEALTNAIRHASPSRIRIRQRHRADEVFIEVSDNGRGIRPEEEAGPKSFGIFGMVERARVFDGSVRIRGGVHGTRVVVRMPLHGAHA